MTPPNQTTIPGSAAEFVRAVGQEAAGAAVDFYDEAGLPLRPRWRGDLSECARQAVVATALLALPYSIDGRLKVVKRPEELDEHELLQPIWPRINAHLGTNAYSLEELVEQLGIARFGHRPVVATPSAVAGQSRSRQRASAAKSMPLT